MARQQDLKKARISPEIRGRIRSLLRRFHEALLRETTPERFVRLVCSDAAGAEEGARGEAPHTRGAPRL
jgi:hypothetical protein